MHKALDVKLSNDSLVLTGFPTFLPEENWTAALMSKDHLWGKKQNPEVQPLTAPTNLGWVASHVLLDILTGRHLHKWSGSAQIDTGFGVKTLHFVEGEICFAESNLFDDRLGEIAYRQGVITLEELSQSAVQVTRDLKFGQVLVQSHIFSNYGLWQALKGQVKEIVRSIFMVEKVYLELSDDVPQTATRVIFKEGTSELLQESFAYGFSLQTFIQRLSSQSSVIAIDLPPNQRETGVESGTFFKDLLAIVKTKISVVDLLDQSKLSRPYTLDALRQLVYTGVCQIEDLRANLSTFAAQNELDQRILKYHLVLTKMSKAFDEQNISAPLEDLGRLASSLGLFVQPNGLLVEDSIFEIQSQCLELPNRKNHFLVSIGTLIEFCLVLVNDQLTEAVGFQIRKESEELSS